MALSAGRHGSALAGTAAARRAIDLVAPAIEASLADRSVCGSGFLHMVVLDPALDAGDAPFDQAVLAERSFGDVARWDADYAAYARAKAKLAWRERCSGSELLARAPHRLREGDSPLAGAVWLDGIVVAASGAHADFDEAFALAIAAALRAIARRTLAGSG